MKYVWKTILFFIFPPYSFMVIVSFLERVRKEFRSYSILALLIPSFMAASASAQSELDGAWVLISTGLNDFKRLDTEQLSKSKPELWINGNRAQRHIWESIYVGFRLTTSRDGYKDCWYESDFTCTFKAYREQLKVEERGKVRGLYRLDGDVLIVETNWGDNLGHLSTKGVIFSAGGTVRPDRYVDPARDTRQKAQLQLDPKKTSYSDYVQLSDGLIVRRQVFQRLPGLNVIDSRDSSDLISATVHNASKRSRRAQVRIELPNGYSLVSESDSKYVTVPPGKTVDVSWRVHRGSTETGIYSLRIRELQ